MTARLLLLMLSLPFVLILSGCSGLGVNSASGAVASAKELAADAEAFAKKSGHDADLLAVVTLEVKDPAPLKDRGLPDWMDPFLVADTTVGDGRAPAWGYLYGTAGMAMDMGGDSHTHGGAGNWLVVVGADHKQKYAGDPTAAFPIVPANDVEANWTEDSSAVAAKLAPKLESALTSKDGYVWETLSQRVNMAPAWLFEAGTTDSGINPLGAADARDGAVLNLGNRDPWAATPTELGTIQGTATTNGGKAASFSIGKLGHKQLEFILQVTPAATGGGTAQTANDIEFSADGPGGQQFNFHWDGSDGNNQDWWQWDAPNPGDWAVMAKVDQGQGTGFSIKWCAIGATRCIFP